MQFWLVGGVALAVVLIVIATRYFPVERTRPVRSSSLEPGLYFLSSGGCDTCAAARRRLDRAGVPYRELVWQKDAGHFDEMGIDGVPSVVEVGEGGAGRWWRGGVPLRFRLRRR